MRAMASEQPLSVPEAILQRRNVRHFREEPIDDALLERLIQLTVRAPSSWNFQPWRIVVVREPARRALLAEACFRQPQVREAPVDFVFAVSQMGWRHTMDEIVETARRAGAWPETYVEMLRKVAPQSQEALGARLREFNTKDALIAATHLALAAESLGLGSAYLNGYDEEKVKDVVGAGGDPDIGVCLVMAVGHPAERGSDPGRLPISRTVFSEDLRTPWQGAAPGGAESV